MITGTVTRAQAEAAAIAALTPYQLEDYKEYKRDLKKYAEDKATTFVVVLGQCSEDAKMKLKSSYDLDQLEQDCDVTGLLKALKMMAFAPSGAQDPWLALCVGLRRVAAINQGTNEGIVHYKRRFLAATQVLDEQWGGLIPPKLKGNLSNEEAKEKFLSRLLLSSVDKKRYGELLDDLSNAYLSGKKDGYPESLDATVDLLSHYQNNGVQVNRSGGKYGQRVETSFIQSSGKSSKRIQCYECKEYGHRKDECPKKKQTDDAKKFENLGKPGWNHMQTL
jgi:hypothetical protein